MAYSWPGNVRELRNVVQRAYVMAVGAVISDEFLPSDPGPKRDSGGQAAAGVDSITVPVGASIAQVERQLILATFVSCGRNKERTAAVLGVSLKTLYNRLKEFADESPDGEPAALSRPGSSV
jgi:DNA-binding NtrC family response regulator